MTGTVLSFEMGLLWPGLMRQYGAVLGVPFGVEGLFFFLEAIFAGIYLWGWRRLGGWAHWWSGVPIAVSGIFGAMSVVAVNAWMNTPGVADGLLIMTSLLSGMGTQCPRPGWQYQGLRPAW